MELETGIKTGRGNMLNSNIVTFVYFFNFRECLTTLNIPF